MTGYTGSGMALRQVIVHCPMHAQAKNMLAALEKFLAVVDESEGITGWHLNGAVAEWCEFDFIEDMREAAARGGAA
jgi:hypothetical protein